MRSQCNQRFKGTGVWSAFVEDIEMYSDKSVNVRLPNNPKNAAEYAALCGPVKVYYLNQPKEEQPKYGNR